jgi:hypothetical protein
MPGRNGSVVRRRTGLSVMALVGCGIIVAGCQGSQPGQIGLGTLGGAAAGGAIGSTIGGGKGNTLAIVGGALLGGALGNQMVDKPVQQQQQAQAEASRDRAMQRQLDYERQSALQNEQVRREIQEQRLFDEWKRERVGDQAATAPVSRQDIMTAQRLLTGLGYYSGPFDGLQGPATEAAVRRFQASQNLPQTGVVTQGLIDQMRTTI